MRLVRLIGILGTVLAALASPSVLLAQSSPKSAHATRVGGRAPSVDGVLDDPAWSAVAPIRDFSQKVPLEGAEPSVATEVRLVYDDDALYVGARMHHPDPASIRTTLTRRDGSSDAERLVISLDTYLDRRTAYSFGVSAASRSQTESCPTDHGPAVPDSGSGPCGISCPSTHPIVSSLHGRTASAHVALGSCLARGGSRLAQAGCRTRKGSLKCLSLVQDAMDFIRYPGVRLNAQAQPEAARSASVPLLCAGARGEEGEANTDSGAHIDGQRRPLESYAQLASGVR